MKRILAALSLIGAAAVFASGTGILCAAAEDAPFDYTAYAEPYAVHTGILDAPTVAFKVDSAFDLSALNTAKTPAVAIFTVDGAGNAVDADGNAIAPLDDAVRACAHRVIPAFYFEDTAGMRAALKYVSGRNLLDAMVFSDDAALVQAFKASRANIQGGVYFRSVDLTQSGAAARIRNEVNEANGMIAVVGGSVTKAGIEEIRSLGISCWALTESTQIGVYNALYAGADGIVSDNFSLPIAVMEGIAQPLLVRKVFYSGHRGESTYPENTIVGAQAAYYYGADYVELDLMRTADNELVVMHDTTLNRTCPGYTGTQQIAQMTLEEVRQYKVGGSYEVPVLEDFLQFAAERPDLKLLVELKTNDAEVVPILVEKLGMYDVDDQIIVISSFPDRLKDFRASMPHISCNNLNSYADLQSMSYYAYTLNCSFGPGYTYLDSADVIRQARVRGIPVYAWTFRTAAVYEEYMQLCTSLTSDFGSYAKEQFLLLDVGTETEYTASQTFAAAGSVTVRQRQRSGYSDRAVVEAPVALSSGAVLSVGELALSSVASYADGTLSVGTQSGYGIYYFTAVYEGNSADYAIMSQPFEVCAGADVQQYRTPLDEEEWRTLAETPDREPETDPEPEPEEPETPEKSCAGCGTLGTGGTGGGIAAGIVGGAALLCTAPFVRRGKER